MEEPQKRYKGLEETSARNSAKRVRGSKLRRNSRRKRTTHPRGLVISLEVGTDGSRISYRVRGRSSGRNSRRARTIPEVEVVTDLEVAPAVVRISYKSGGIPVAEENRSHKKLQSRSS